MLMSIKAEGIEKHIDSYFKQRQLPYGFKDVLYWKDLRIGGEPVSMTKQMKELGMNAKQTLYTWHREIDSM